MIGTPVVDCHYLPLEVNSCLTSSIWQNKSLSLFYGTKIRYKIYTQDTYIKIILVQEYKTPLRSQILPKAHKSAINPTIIVHPSILLFMSYLHNQYQVEKVCLLFMLYNLLVLQATSYLKSIRLDKKQNNNSSSIKFGTSCFHWGLTMNDVDWVWIWRQARIHSKFHQVTVLLKLCF